LTNPYLDFGMASKEQSFHIQNPLIVSSSTLSTKTGSVPRRDAVRVPMCAWKTQPLFAVSNVRERIASSLFSVLESPKFIFSAESQFQTEQEVVEACGGAGPIPFLLNGSTLYTLSPPTKSSFLGRALKEDTGISQELFAAWFSDPRRSKWAIELLNRFLRMHAWKRGLRFDEGHALFYFTRSKPKKLWWEVGGRIAQREVTAPDMKHYEVCGKQEVEFQCGWKHEAVRAGFVVRRDCLFVQLEPAWFLTELD
jgi:hypothetical protein